MTIYASHYLLADRDGVCILPGDRAEAIIAEAETAIKTENLASKAILKCSDPQEAYLK